MLLKEVYRKRHRKSNPVLFCWGASGKMILWKYENRTLLLLFRLNAKWRWISLCQHVLVNIAVFSIKLECQRTDSGLRAEQGLVLWDQVCVVALARKHLALTAAPVLLAPKEHAKADVGPVARKLPPAKSGSVTTLRGPSLTTSLMSHYMPTRSQMWRSVHPDPCWMDQPTSWCHPLGRLVGWSRYARPLVM